MMSTNSEKFYVGLGVKRLGENSIVADGLYGLYKKALNLIINLKSPIEFQLSA